MINGIIYGISSTEDGSAPMEWDLKQIHWISGNVDVKPPSKGNIYKK